MKDYTGIIKSVICSIMQNYNDNNNANTQFHALGIPFSDVIYAIILIEKSLDIDFITQIDRYKILNYTVNDFISIAEKTIMSD